MPAPILHLGATVICLHGGQALPTAPFPRVLVSGQAIVTQTCLYSIAGCALASGSTPPCVTGQWVTAATRVLAGGAPVVIVGSQAVCAAPGTGLNILVTQTRALAT
jgi:hypothetical protein